MVHQLAAVSVFGLKFRMIVWLASYPRSGNTFFRSLLNSLYNEAAYSVYNERTIERMGMASILGPRKPPGTVAEMQRAERVFFVKTHELPSDESPAIYLVRDGRDASVSQAHFLIGGPMGVPRRASVRVRAAWKLLGYNRYVRTLEGVVSSGEWQDHALAWTGNHRSGPTFVLRYEDLISDPVRRTQEALEGVGMFLEPRLGTPLTFDALHARWPHFFRRGVVGSWREEMPEDIHEMFWRRSRTAMLRFGYDEDAPPALQPTSVSSKSARRAQSFAYSKSEPALIIRENANDFHAGSSVSMSRLGQSSNWGTTVFQYMFLKSFARHHRMVAEVPPWLGQDLFLNRDTAVTGEHEVVVCDNLSLSGESSDQTGVAASALGDRVRNLIARGKTVYILNDSLLNDSGVPLPFRHADLDGPFVLHSRMLAPHRDYLRGLFQPLPAQQEFLNETLKLLRERGKTLIGLHYLHGHSELEVGDWNAGVTPLSWYSNWLKKAWHQFEHPVILLCTDSPQRALSELAEFNPVTVQKLAAETSASCQAFGSALPGPHALTLVEWLLLSRCDVLAIANDPASFTAAMINQAGREFWRPTPQMFQLIDFDPWDAAPILSLPRRVTLPGELAQRIRLIHENGGRRAVLASLGLLPSTYARILRSRLLTSYRLGGGRGVLRELIDPNCYLAARRIPMVTSLRKSGHEQTHDR